MKVEKPGPRQRKEYTASDKARKELRDGWGEAATHYIKDCDAVLRLCKAAQTFGIFEGLLYAREAAELRSEELAKYRDAKGRIVAPDLDFRTYSSYSKVARFHQLQAEETVLRKLEAALRSDLSAPAS